MPKSFRTSHEFRRWLERHHANRKELIVRLFKVHARHRGIGYREALDEALCYGWIDGIKRALDEDSFTHRFSPRRPRSKWSLVNIKRFKELRTKGRVRPPGLAAFDEKNVAAAPYSFESQPLVLDPALEKRFRADKKAWKFFQSEPPGRRRLAVFWVMSAKRPETRERRLGHVIQRCAQGKRIGVLA